MKTPAHPATPAGAARLDGQLVGFLHGGFAVLVWGSYLAVSRAGVVGAGLQPWDFALFRFLPAGLLGVLVLATRLRHDGLTWPGWARALALTACGGPLFIACATGGYLFAPLPHGAVIQPGSAVVMGLLFARLSGDASAKSTTWLGASLIVLGLVLANVGGGGSGGNQVWVGDCLFFAAGSLWAGFTSLLKRWSIDPITGTSVVAVLSLGVTLPLYWAMGNHARLDALAPAQLALQFVMQGVLAGFFAVVAFVKAVRILGPARVSLLPALVPMCAILVGIPLTGERPSQAQFAGLAVVTLGLAFATGLSNHVFRRPPAV